MKIYELIEDSNGYADILVCWGDMDELETGVGEEDGSQKFGNGRSAAIKFCRQLEKEGYRDFDRIRRSWRYGI